MQEIQMVDLRRQYDQLKNEINASVMACMENGAFVRGREVTEFESALGHYIGGAHVISCANGTDALQIALMALDLEPGDEVIVPSFTFVASVEVIALLGLKPIVVDVDPDTFLMRPEDIEPSLSPRTRAIIPVHLYGQCVDMKSLLEIARQRDLYIIEDNAQSIGARCDIGDGNNPMSGTIGHIGCTSFYPSKNLGCYGDGGAMFATDEKMAHALRMVANHGMDRRYYHDMIGVNSRLDTIQAAILSIKLPHLDRWNQLRRQFADSYDARLKDITGITIPVRAPWSEHVFHQYTLKVADGRRDALMTFLKDKGIPSMIYYPVPMHEQAAYTKLVRRRVSLENTEKISQEVLSLPMHPHLTVDEIDYIHDAIRQFFQQ
jgi:UDP-2-acetamido-2-deoxy-ribo-hexuluronate aminotransferase